MSDSSPSENDTPRPHPGEGRYSQLPEPVRPEDMIEMVDATSRAPGGDDETHARERMLPYSAPL